jgi:hypothetical protein
MTARADFAYAQARMQARHGRSPGTPDAPAWHALEASRTAAQALAAARAWALAEWVDGLDDAGDAHAIESGLRARWHRHVDEVAHWLPLRWQAAVRWFATLADLPWIAATAVGNEQRSAALDPAARAQALRDAGLAPFAEGAATLDASAAVAIWRAEWQRLAPAAEPVLLRPAELLLPRLLGAGAMRPRNQLATRDALQRLFRRHAGSAVAVTAHLALVALDLERLRGELVERSLFEPGPAPQAT